MLGPAAPSPTSSQYNPNLKPVVFNEFAAINTIDPIVGALAEDHLPGSSVGPLVAAGLRVQFERLRDADRFWYERDTDFTPADVELLHNTRLSDIIMRNTDLTNLQGNVFFVPQPLTSVMVLGILGTLACTRTGKKS